MKLATIQASGDDYASSTPEAIAVARISMQQEFDSLVRPYAHLFPPPYSPKLNPQHSTLP